MRALGAGVVSESRDNDFTVGDAVAGWVGWQEEAVVRADAMVRRIAETDLPLSLSLGVLGINGVTAHPALTGIGEPRAGDTLLVSTAAGAVGSAVGQIGKTLRSAENTSALQSLMRRSYAVFCLKQPT